MLGGDVRRPQSANHSPSGSLGRRQHSRHLGDLDHLAGGHQRLRGASKPTAYCARAGTTAH
jgi:hypothetical protein